MRIPVIVGGDSGINVGSDSGPSWAASAEMLAAALFTVSRAPRQALSRFAFALWQGLALEFEPMSGTQETIQQSISHGRDP